MSKTVKKTVCMVLLIAAIILGTDVVWANSVLTGWQSASMSSENAGTRCPLEVKKERIIFDIPDFAQYLYTDVGWTYLGTSILPVYVFCCFDYGNGGI